MEPNEELQAFDVYDFRAILASNEYSLLNNDFLCNGEEDGPNLEITVSSKHEHSLGAFHMLPMEDMAMEDSSLDGHNYMGNNEIIQNFQGLDGHLGAILKRETYERNTKPELKKTQKFKLEGRECINNGKGSSAIDPQCFYARRRRERINARLRILQSLIPNGTKV
ncbi:hypothetical protein AMTR_s00066p00183410 [Amborella trichopoda]|uniref:BHLH domain-containing protein n=2 Tax=Amborella trichopoda TaxID=13333 RepID=U5DCQ2_AMBTC|nr:hypothetical protein AMTR_s00066p00183410 [Amborella trichopoda]